MANKKISELTSATLPLAGTEELAIVQSGETKKVSASDLGGGGGGVLSFHRAFKAEVNFLGFYGSETFDGWPATSFKTNTAKTTVVGLTQAAITPFAVAPCDMILKEVIINAKIYRGLGSEFTVGVGHYKQELGITYTDISATSGNTALLEQKATSPVVDDYSYVENFTNVAWDSLVIPKGDCIAVGLKKDLGVNIELFSCDITLFCEKV